jgi:hypothetical protein
VVVVRAADKDWRFCVDYGRINSISQSNPFPLPNLVGVLEWLAGHKFYAKFDLRRGYHQLMVDPRDRHLTAFVCESGVYEFVRLPFGLMNAPAFFQRQMSTAVLAGLIHVSCESYIDDISVFAETEEELLRRCREVLTRCREFGVCLSHE